MQISKYLARRVFFIIIIIIIVNIIGMYPVRETHIFEEELKWLFWCTECLFLVMSLTSMSRYGAWMGCGKSQ